MTQIEQQKKREAASYWATIESDFVEAYLRADTANDEEVGR